MSDIERELEAIRGRDRKDEQAFHEADNVSAYGGWDPLPLARALLIDHACPPVAALAAWRSLYRGDHQQLTQLALAAASCTCSPGVVAADCPWHDDTDKPLLYACHECLRPVSGPGPCPYCGGITDECEGSLIETIRAGFRHMPGHHHHRCSTAYGNPCDCYYRHQEKSDAALDAVAAKLADDDVRIREYVRAYGIEAQERGRLEFELAAAWTALEAIREKANWYACNDARQQLEVDHALCVEVLVLAEDALAGAQT